MSLTSDLQELFRQKLGPHAEELAVPGNRPVVLGDVSCVWITLSGRLELFSMRVRDDRLHGQRRHFATCLPGQLVMARDYARVGDDSVLIGVGDQDTRVLLVPTRALSGLLDEPRLSEVVITLFERWVTTLAQAGAPAERPRRFQQLTPGQLLSAGAQEVYGCQGVCWVPTGGAKVSVFGRHANGREGQPGWLPATPDTWLAIEAGELTVRGTGELLRADPWQATFLSDFYEYALALSLARQESVLARQGVDDYRAQESDLSQLATALGRLARLGSDVSQQNLLFKSPTLLAMEAVATDLGLALPEVPEALLRGEGAVQIEALARLLKVRVRQVTLDPLTPMVSVGPLIGYLRVGELLRPVALSPRRAGHYELFDPADGSRRAVSTADLRELEPRAYQFYRALPARPLGILEVLRFGMRGLARDAAFMVAVGTLGSLLGLVTPILTGHVYDSLIPEAERGLVVQLMLVAAGLTLGGLLFDLARRIAMVRAESLLNSSLQPALWDRLLSLPLPFFRGYNAGDLTLRVESVDQIQQVLAHGTLAALLAAVFSFWNLLLLFYYDLRLALVALLVSSAVAACAALIALTAMDQERRVIAMSGQLEGFLLQMLTGIHKLRVSATESRAFRVWAHLFGTKRDAEQGVARAHNRFRALHAAYPLLSSALLFWLVAQTDRGRFSTGDFLAFSAAFGAMSQALLACVDGMLSALAVVPLLERARPILEATPEIDELKSPPGELLGQIEINQVSFRYDPSGPPVLDDVSFTIEPGRFVGLVGPSGSGKSTLLRLMLGLDLPATGNVYFDGRALSGLDTREVRRQIGTVTQTSQLMEGDILSNIVGATGLGIEAAERAAAQAGMAADIASFPMGMHTLVSQGGGNLSGGQRQRILIARALVSQPRILLFDEATSALDNQTQEQVSRALEKLNVTRVVVAHRLSTVRRADRIFVLERGKLVESGTYDELMARNGAFARLARRQLL